MDLERGEPLMVWPIANGFAVQRASYMDIVGMKHPEIKEFGDRDRLLKFLQRHFIWPPDGVTDGMKREE